MTAVRIRLESGDEDVQGAPIVVYASPYPRGRSDQRVGWVGEELFFDLPPGLYGIRAELPSGRSLTASVTVADQPEEIRLEVGDALALFTDSAQRSWGELINDAWIRLWQSSESGWRVIPWPSEPVVRTPNRVTYRLPSADEPRMLQTGGTGVVPQLTVVPQRTDLSVTVRPMAGADRELAVFVLAADPVVESVRNYSTHRGRALAELVARYASKRAPEGPEDLAVLLRFVLDSQRPGVRPAGRSPRTPDDLILEALMDQFRSPQRSDAILVRAARAALPAWTQSLRLLVDYLRENREPGSERALASLDPYLLAADLTQTAVTFAGEAPDRPDLRATDPHQALPYPEFLAPFDAALTDDILEILQDIPYWTRAGSEWTGIARIINALGDDVQARAVEQATTDFTNLELAGPSRSPATGTTSVPAEVIRASERLTEILNAARLR